MRRKKEVLEAKPNLAKEKTEGLSTISFFGGLELLLQLSNGRGAVLEALGRKGLRTKLLSGNGLSGKAPTFLFTHPTDCRELFIENSERLNKHGHAFDALRNVFGRGLIPIETGSEWKSNQRIVGKHMQPKNLPNLDVDTEHYLLSALQQKNASEATEFIIDNVNEMLIDMNFQLTAKSFFGREASLQEAKSVSHDIHTVNQFLLANAVLSGLPNALYQKTPLFLSNVHKAEKSFKRYAEEIVNADTPLTGYMQAIINAGPLGEGLMTPEAQRDEVILAIISSYVSTATAAGWALHHVGKPEHAHLQKVIRAEAQSQTHLSPSSMTWRIVKEGLRLFPPVFLITRKATQDIYLENHLGKMSIPEGSSIFISPYITHHDPQFWENPSVFDPNRFEKNKNDAAFFPFGLGERKCIGEHYAMRVAVMSLGHIFNQYNVEMLKPSQPMFRATLHPSHELSLKFKKI